MVRSAGWSGGAAGVAIEITQTSLRASTNPEGYAWVGSIHPDLEPLPRQSPAHRVLPLGRMRWPRSTGVRSGPLNSVPERLFRFSLQIVDIHKETHHVRVGHPIAEAAQLGIALGVRQGQSHLTH
jgi:hypothetical protein